MPTPRIAALIRVSTADQDIEVQRQQITRWATANSFDPKAIAWHAEDAVSGAAASRPVLDELLRGARAGKVDVLVVAALDRLGRSAVRVLSNIDELNRHGVRFVSLREGVDFGTSVGKLVAGIFASLAEFERDLIRDRTRAGLATARRRGVRLGAPALTWRAEELAELRALRTSGHTLEQITAADLVRVFDTQGRPRTPSVRAMRRALAASA